MRARFGRFELDTEKAELSNDGVSVPLRDQPLQVLIALVEQAGNVVTRDQLRQLLWNDRAFGDFEAGLNTAISRLRQVLNDSVESPQFIQTIPKRGYRFIAPVTSVSPRSCKPEAYEAFVRGQFLAKRHTPANIARAIEYFDEAMRLDPGFALPYYAASMLHIVTALIGVTPPSQAMAAAEQSVARGCELDPNSADTHRALAFLRMCQWRWAESETAYRRAIELSPNDPHPHAGYAHLCSFQARHDEGLREAHHAMALAPLDSLMNFRVVQCLYFARRYGDTIRSARKTIELAPEFPSTYSYLARALVETGQPDEGWDIAQKGRTLGAGQPIMEGMYGYVAGITRHTPEAVGVLQALEARRQSGYCSAQPIGWTHLGLGNTEAYLDCLAAAFEEREPFLASEFVFPGSDRVRNDSRFDSLFRRLGFTH
jgi:DNA-binding winged helix-turn-helix (wHTH) protein